MFYAHFVLSKKGPLARIWLAAHWDKKLTKAHVFETNIEGSIEEIIQPKAKLALRTSGHLLLGVVRIYSRKAKYLLADCNEAFVKIKMAFRPGVVDLPEENREAAMSSITLPEAFHEFDTTMADLSDLDVHPQFTGNQSRPEEITMREDLGNITLVGDDGFGDLGFDGGMMEDTQMMDESLYLKHGDPSGLLLDGASEKDEDGHQMDIDFDDEQNDGDAFSTTINDDYEGPAGADDDDESGGGGDNFDGSVEPDLFGDNFVGESGGLFEDPMMSDSFPAPTDPINHLLTSPQHKTGALDPFASPSISSFATDVTINRPIYMDMGGGEDGGGGGERIIMHLNTSLRSPSIIESLALTQNDDTEAFALKPIDITSIGTERKVKKKRKLVIDELKAITSETMKLQLSDSSDIVTTLDLAPPTKKLMHWKETGGVEKLFYFPGRSLVSKKLARLFTVNLITKSSADDVDTESTRDDLDLENVRAEEELLEGNDLRNTTSEMPHLPLAAQEAYRPTTTEAPSIVDDSLHLTDKSSSRISFIPDISTSNASVAPPHELPPSSPPPPPLLPPASQTNSPPSLVGYGGGGNSDDHDDDNDDGELYNEDASTEPEQEEEPVEGEAEEEAEERRWNKRSQQMLHALTRILIRHDSIGFKDVVAHSNRKQVASKFYTLLVLKKSQAVSIEQSEPYGDVTITKGPSFTEIC